MSPATSLVEEGPRPIDGVGMESWILRFDQAGGCTSPRTRELLLQQLRAKPRGDVILFSHGWNNDFDDALALYRDYLRSLERLLQSHPAPRPFDPIFVGIVWPSIWLDFDGGPRIAADGPAADVPALEQAAIDLVERTAAASPAAGAAERVQVLLARTELELAEAQELTRLIAPVFEALSGDDGAGAERIADPHDLILVLRVMQRMHPAGVTAMLRDLDDWSVPSEQAHTGMPANAGGIRAAGSLEAYDPRMLLRLFSIYQMKDRAGTVGNNGVAALLRDLLAVTATSDTAASGTAVHAVGHSFGCKVLLSAICAPAPMTRPLRSVLLLQPAVSHLCFAQRVPGTGRAGGYAAALRPERVTAPIYSTYSRQDLPLHDVFHLGLQRATDLGEIGIAADGDTSAGRPPSVYAALGGYGPREAGQFLVDPMPAPGNAYPAAPDGTPIVAFDGSAGSITGHGDVRGGNAAWALHRLMFR